MEHKSLTDKIISTLGITSGEAESLAESFVSIIRNTVSEGDTVSLPGFGSFEPRFRAERVSVQPSTGRRLLVPPRVAVAFRPSATLKRRIRDISPMNANPDISDTSDDNQAEPND
ncbi:MAG: HU family DNA-binding protein [Muribaculaceae bacterium]|nr:HU family DNA-binding protein [Muribaculaceae bacterium]